MQLIDFTRHALFRNKSLPRSVSPIREGKMGLSSVCNFAESEAIRLAQRGDALAFERLYRLHSRRVYSLCLRMVAGNSAQAEDFTQDVFLQLFRKIQSFRSESAFSTWLHRLTVNIVLMRLRRKSHIVASIEEMNQEKNERDESVQPWEPGGPDLQLTGVVDRLHLERAIGQLPPGSRAMFVLHEVEGYEHEEIARMRGCTVGNSKSQLHKARVRLRQILHEATGNGSCSSQAPALAASVVIPLKYPAVASRPRLTPSLRSGEVRAPSRSARPEFRSLLASRAY
jgi:RNA polymerase sigma-70 factor (ECF subfamily)